MEGVEDAWTAPGLGSTAVFLAIVGAVAVILVRGLAAAADGSPGASRRSTLGAGAAVLGWMTLTGAYVASGLPERGGPFFMAFFAVSNVVALGVAASPLGGRLAALPVVLLIAPQALRLPLELVLHTWADGGTIPVQMTFEGHNFDIVTGVFALVVAGVGWTRPLPRWLVWVFNLVGTGLLLAVMAIALLSSPLPLKSYDGPPLLLALHLPYAWILPMCVSPALLGHVLVFRALMGRPRLARER